MPHTLSQAAKLGEPETMLRMLRLKHTAQQAAARLQADVQAAQDACQSIIDMDLMATLELLVPPGGGLLARLRTASHLVRDDVRAAIPPQLRDMLRAAEHVTVHGVWQQLQVVQSALEEVEGVLEGWVGGDDRFAAALETLQDELCATLDTLLEDAEALECLVQQVRVCVCALLFIMPCFTGIWHKSNGQPARRSYYIAVVLTV